MAQKLSRLPATDGQEKSHRDGSLPLRKVRLEGLAAPGNANSSPSRGFSGMNLPIGGVKNPGNANSSYPAGLAG